MEKTKCKFPNDQTLVLERYFDAPRELVFAAWTQPEHLVKWSAPHGFTVPECRGEFREGGEFYTLMISPDGEKHALTGVYIEIVPDELLVTSHGWLEDDGTRPHETIVKVRFADEGKGTRITFEQSGFKSVESRDRHADGWSQCIDKLATLLEKLKAEN